jgi:hypothetical protein
MSVFPSARQRPALLATLLLGLVSTVGAYWASFGLAATYHRTRTTRSVRVDDTDAGHEHGAALDASIHQSAGSLTFDPGSAGDDHRDNHGAHAVLAAAFPPFFRLESRLRVPKPRTSTQAFSGFSAGLRAPPFPS